MLKYPANDQRQPANGATGPASAQGPRSGSPLPPDMVETVVVIFARLILYRGWLLETYCFIYI